MKSKKELLDRKYEYTEFLLRAADHFLCPSDDVSTEDMLDSLYLSDMNNSHNEPEDDVLVWEPFVGYSVSYMIDVIGHLASCFKKFYDEGTKVQRGED